MTGNSFGRRIAHFEKVARRMRAKTQFLRRRGGGRSAKKEKKVFGKARRKFGEEGEEEISP